MELTIQSLRTFIGAKDYAVSRSFYAELGFEEFVISEKMSIQQRDGHVFYLQDYYVEDWLGNTMLLIAVNNAALCDEWLKGLALEQKYAGVKVLPLKSEDWADVCRVIGPAGELLHFAQFRTNG
jgi:hypothetical protein